MKKNIYKFTADITFSYDDNGVQHDAKFSISADIGRNTFDDAVVAYKKYVGNLLHDLLSLAIPEAVKKGVKGTLNINYMCEAESYYDVDSDDVYVDINGITYSWETHHDATFESKRVVTNIKWDTDDEEVDLPNQMVIPDDIDDDADAIGDYLSDETDFCHFGFNIVYETTIKVDRKDAKIINDLLSGKDLDWDVNETHSVNAEFHNGATVDVLVCCPPESHTNDPESSPWTQACWYDKDGESIGCSGAEDNFFGDWEMTVENDPNLCGPVSYIVHVVEE